ncbi:hypothetical protein IHN63_04065 [Deinococcus sp. 6YEL10]|uniref:hypothetical protein n=1 Tax=Deinococcus sp. 6YEL10 TaxID=2745870 RepID=UPI001E4008B9|nr:hypothetical protein [Deinococcus sp. 6YEL10]MCD0160479.1 hypothetical protein [Deinococcus sp. 6YEL10]
MTTIPSPSPSRPMALSRAAWRWQSYADVFSTPCLLLLELVMTPALRPTLPGRPHSSILQAALS